MRNGMSTNGRLEAKSILIYELLNAMGGHVETFEARYGAPHQIELTRIAYHAGSPQKRNISAALKRVDIKR
jgi:hypothetical protein